MFANVDSRWLGLDHVLLIHELNSIWFAKSGPRILQPR